MVADPTAGNGSGRDSISLLRHRLVRARIDHDLSKLVQVEDELRRLATEGYRCCLIDYEALRPSYYVRLIGYEKARVKVELEYPIEPRVDPVQWLPLSHLADYHEAESGDRLSRIYDGLAPFIQCRSMPLRTSDGERGKVPLLSSGGGSAQVIAGGNRVRRHRRPESAGRRWLLTAGVVLLMGLSWFIGLQMGRVL